MCGDIKGLQRMTRKRMFQWPYCGAPRGKVPQSTTRASENRLICQAAELGADRNHQHDAAGIGQIFGVVAKGRRQRADLVSPIEISSAA
jgi:hypothetical protein